MPANDPHGRRFGEAAGAYERGRPDYPAGIVDWLLEGHPRRMVELGAGTGKLTRALVGRVGSLVAVEPDAGMRAAFAQVLPDVDVLPGSGEHIPLDNHSAEAVVASQAWHWVDPERAVPEVARVLRPGGRLGLLWNTPDQRLGWVRELGEIVGFAHDPLDAHSGLPAPFTDVERHRVEWTNYLTPQALIDLVASRSYCITSPADVQTRALERVRELLATHPALANSPGVALPYITTCVRTDLG